jgi:hypothetical protein
MVEISRKKLRHLQPVIDNSKSVEPTRMDDQPIRHLIAAGMLGIYALIYFLQELFNANNLNDFSEYYLRAEDWAKGSFVNNGGSDVLLSAIECIGIAVHPNDFLASYFLASKILISVVVLACFVFIVRRNDVLPDYWTKLAVIIVTLSIPHFIFATVTIDQTILFVACLLLFLSTYNIPWCGPISALAFFSRPEAIIIIPMYLLLYIVDTSKRRMILINAATFIAVLVALKFAMSIQNTAYASSGDFQEYGFIDKLSWSYFVGLLQHVSRIPAKLVTYAYECLQSSLLFILFIVGFVTSLRQRTSWAMYGVLIMFLFSYAVLYADAQAQPYSYFTTLIKRMSLEKDYFIVNAFNKFDPQLGHGRYRLVLYPPIVFFALQGIRTLVVLITSIVSHNALKQRKDYATYGLAATIAVMMLRQYAPIAEAYSSTKKLNEMHPVYKLGLNMRKQGAGGKVFIDNFCDPSQGSFLMEFAAYSGFRTVLTRFCDQSPIWIKDSTGNSRVLLAPEYKQQMPRNSSLLAEFETATANLHKLFDTIAIGQWERVALQYDARQMSSDSVRYVIASRVIPVPHLKVVDSLEGAFVHCFQNLR